MPRTGRPRSYHDDRVATPAERKARWLAAHPQTPTLHLIPTSQAEAPYETDLAALVASGQRFGCIVADPPWPYANQATRGSTHHHYQAMSIEALCALPVRDLALPQSHLHLWTTSAFLFTCPQILAAWGFTHKGEMVWAKPTMGLGNYYRIAHELCLLGVRGELTARQHNIISWFQATRGEHSAKPDIARDRIEQLSPGPYLELFGRKAVPGWTVWGNQQQPAQGRLFKEQVG
jgi:N6-adenosine-specific RNA methylase IME4